MTVKPAYRTDFLLVTITGNITRYLIVRPLVDLDKTIHARWYPIRTWVAGDWLRFLPGTARIRARHLFDSWRAFVGHSPDATVIHAFETYYLYVLSVMLRRSNTAIVFNPDGDVPGIDSTHGPSRLQNIVIKRTDMFVPWSDYTAKWITRQIPHLDSSRIRVLHPGIDLHRWTFRGVKQRRPGEPFNVLFVGGDLKRKGADILLSAIESHQLDGCRVTIATQSASLQSNSAIADRLRTCSAVDLRLDVQPGSDELKYLYSSADAFVLPTNFDLSPWVAIEAMATGVPVVITGVGGIPDIVIDGVTGTIIPPNAPRALAAAVQALRASDTLCRSLAARGRRHVEEHFDAERNTELFLQWVKEVVDRRQRGKARCSSAG